MFAAGLVIFLLFLIWTYEPYFYPPLGFPLDKLEVSMIHSKAILFSKFIFIIL